MAEDTNERVSLTRIEAYHLFNWLSAQKDRLIRERPSKDDVAKEAVAALKFPVNGYQIQRAANDLGISWMAKVERAKTGNVVANLQADIGVLALYLQELHTKMGEPVPGPIKELVERARGGI